MIAALAVLAVGVHNLSAAVPCTHCMLMVEQQDLSSSQVPSQDSSQASSQACHKPPILSHEGSEESAGEPAGEPANNPEATEGESFSTFAAPLSSKPSFCSHQGLALCGKSQQNAHQVAGSSSSQALSDLHHESELKWWPSQNFAEFLVLSFLGIFGGFSQGTASQGRHSLNSTDLFGSLINNTTSAKIHSQISQQWLI